MINIENAIIKSVRFVNLYDLMDGSLLVRLMSQEDAQISATTEADEVVDVTGALIAKINKSKKATYTASETLFNFNLFALQMGTKKVVATEEAKIAVPAVDIKEAVDGKLELTHIPSEPIKYIYKMKDGEVAEKMTLAETGVTEPTEGTFMITDKKVTLPKNSTGQYLIDYTYDSSNAISVSDNTAKFPEAVLFKASVWMIDKCTNKEFLAWAIADKAQIDPSQLDIALNSQGKHPITIDFVKNYCDPDADLFKIIAVKD